MKKIRSKKILTEEEIKAQEAEKELEEQGIQDEFQAKGFEFAEWTQENQGLILGMVGLVFLIGIGTGIANYMKGSGANDASALFLDAKTTYEATVGDAPASVLGGDAAGDDGEKYATAAERATAARTKFEKVASEAGSDGVGAMANLYIGHTSLTLDDYDRAISAYQAFLSGTASDDTLRALGQEGLSNAYDGKGETAQAISALEALVALPGTAGEDLALLKIAKLQDRTGDKASAKATLEKMLADFAESPFKSEADDLMARLKDS